VTTDEGRPVDKRRRELVSTLVTVFVLALVAVKVGNLFDLQLHWLYAVAAFVNVAIVGTWASRRRRRQAPDGTGR
jgi:membrane protein implicated in regulation of membrane protease activity